MELMSMTLRTTSLVIALSFSAATLAAPHGNAAAGKAKAQQVCAACHGADGNKTLDNTYPKLAGQYPDYLSKALHEYKSGKRSNAIMGGQAQGLSEQEIADLSAYFGSLESQIHDLSGHAR
jgi:cytochrome c553